MEYNISVAIPAYNRADFLKETLDAILNQTYPATEIVVVDDGSTDHTLGVIASYGKQIKSVRIDNSGAAIARKKAVELSSCPWIAFCDSDDIWLPNHLERRVSLLKKHPEVNFSFSDSASFGSSAALGKSIYTDAPNNWWKQFGSAEKDNYLLMGIDNYQSFLAFNPAWPTTTLMKRELYDKIGGIDPRYARMVAEDADLTRKAVLHGNVLCDLSITAKQRRHAGNLSTEILKNLLGKCHILENHISLNIAPVKLHSEIRIAINNTLNEAFLTSYYTMNKFDTQIVVSKLKWHNLSLKNKFRFIKLQLIN